MNILFVCRGNTCRSAMAEALAKSLRPVDCVIYSAGTQAFSGSPASWEAIQAMNRFGLSLDRHRSTCLCEALIKWADVIWTMTPERRLQAIHYFPSAGSKIELLSPDLLLEDPIGGSVSEYTGLASLLKQSIQKRFAEKGILFQGL